jgi:hypothetical protein
VDASNVGKLAKEFKRTPKEIREAIHQVKNNADWRGMGGNKNPDVVVDTDGEVYPELPGGGRGEDSIGNILDYLPDKPDN